MLAQKSRFISGRHLRPYAWTRAFPVASMASEARSMNEQVDQIFRETLLPLNDRLLGPLEKEQVAFPAMPVVLCVGNHSSGKSSFLNYVLGQSVQKAGVAPTDDNFTIIAPADTNVDQDGPALVGDPDLGFSGLRSFGTTLLNHVQLKLRKDLDVENIMLIDSPGMIDSPSSMGNTNSDRDRGYDFQKVTRWFAERADVILLFFDPDKPGTTGETLKTLTTALVGLDYKMHIILNKVDQFSRIHDFARAYGSLCWNLSKVIPRKDLPRIYTMCLPVVNDDGTQVDMAVQHKLGPGMADFSATRQEVVGEVLKAPERRLDNMVTRLYDAARLLHMHATVMESVKSRHSSGRLRLYTHTGAAAIATIGLAYLGMTSGAAIDAVAGVCGIGTLFTGGMAYTTQRNEARAMDRLMTPEGLTEEFRRLYFRELAEKDEFVWGLWLRVQPQISVALSTFDIASVSTATRAEMREMDRIVKEVVPSLRRKSSALLSQRGVASLPAETE